MTEVSAIANCSSYIQGGVKINTEVSGGNINVRVRFYMRRTNVYSGDTYNSSSNITLVVSATSYSTSTAINVRGNRQNEWQGPFYEITRTMSADRGGQTINISWSTSAGGYLSGSGSTTITLPTVTSSPTGLSVSNIQRGIYDFTADVSLSSWGVGSGSRYRELQVWTYSGSGLVEPRRYQPQYGDNLSGTITCDNGSYGTLNIQPNTMYVIGAYATNGSANTSSIRFGNYSTLPDTLSSMSGTATSPTTGTISFTTSPDGNQYPKSIEWSLDGYDWNTGATVSTGSAYSGTFNISGLTQGTTNSVHLRVGTDAGYTEMYDTVDIATPLAYKAYVSVEGETKIADKIYASVNGQTKKINKIYSSVEGLTKRVF